jgi:hypothetical protein
MNFTSFSPAGLRAQKLIRGMPAAASLRGGFVELLPVSDFLEARQQIIDSGAALFRSTQVMNNPAPMHHHQAVA